MAKKYTIKKLAVELGIAPSTVHRALSGHPNVSLDTRRKVLHTAHKNGYLLPRHEKGNIAIIISSFSFGGYLDCLLPCLEEEFHRRGARLFLLPEQDIELLGDYMLDGIVSLVWKEGLEKLLPQSFTIPIVVLNGASNGLEHIPSINSDPKGIRMALEYLHKRGCRRIFYLATVTKQSPDAADRLEEFRRFCETTGQNFEKFHLELDKPKVEDEIPFILKSKPDACFCASEGITSKIGLLLKKAGLRIPQDISLMGLEDQWGNECFSPPITAIRQNFEQMAKTAASGIISAYKNKIPLQSKLIPFSLIERESVRNAKMK